MGQCRKMSERAWRHVVLELATLLVEDALAPDVFGRFLEQLARFLPGSSSVLVHDRDERIVETASYRYDSSDARAYIAYFHALNPFPSIIVRNGLLDRTDIFSHWVDQDVFRRSAYYNEFLVPRGERYMLGFSISLDDGTRVGLPIYRGEAEGGDFTPLEARRLDMLRPFVRNAALLRRLARNDVAEAKTASTHAWGDNGDKNVLAARRFIRPARLIFVRRYGLSPREGEVAEYLSAGLSYSEIAQKIGVSYHTVNSHVKSVLRKLSLSSARRLPALLNDASDEF